MNTRFDKILNIVTIVLVMGFIFGFAIAFWLVPDKDFSEQENRFLQSTPVLEADSFFSGEWMEDVASYYSDQFPLRNSFVNIKAIAELAMGKRQNHDVILSSGDFLVAWEHNPNYEVLTKNLKALNTFGAKMEEQNIPVTIALAGRTVDVAPQVLPRSYPYQVDWDLWNEALSLLSKRDALDLRMSLRLTQLEPETIYYRTDHHWTTTGAYHGYVSLMKHWNMDYKSADFFDVTVVSDQFYGTIWSSSGMSWIGPDSMEYYRFDGDMDYTTSIPEINRSFEGFYDTSYLEQKDKYSSFISGNNGVVYVTKNGDNTERETLLLVKDSFAHSMVPFLAIHYDLVIVDMRYYGKPISKLLETVEVDRVLVLVNMETLIDEYQFGLITK